MSFVKTWAVLNQGRRSGLELEIAVRTGKEEKLAMHWENQNGETSLCELQGGQEVLRLNGL